MVMMIPVSETIIYWYLPWNPRHGTFVWARRNLYSTPQVYASIRANVSEYNNSCLPRSTSSIYTSRFGRTMSSMSTIIPLQFILIFSSRLTSIINMHSPLTNQPRLDVAHLVSLVFECLLNGMNGNILDGKKRCLAHLIGIYWPLFLQCNIVLWRRSKARQESLFRPILFTCWALFCTISGVCLYPRRFSRQIAEKCPTAPHP